MPKQKISSKGPGAVALACLFLALLLLLIITLWSLARGDQHQQDFFPAPVQVSTTLRFTAIAAGHLHSCAIGSAGDTYCWGSDRHFQLGSTGPMDDCGAVRCSGTPVRVAGGHVFTQLAAGRRHSCGLTASGAAWCWGYGRDGQLGDGRGSDSLLPVRVAGGRIFTALAANATSASTCGLTVSGEAWCWGGNHRGALGNGTDAGSAHVPVQVMTRVKFIAISISQSTGCGVSTDGDAYCWGDNRYGQLGSGRAGSDGGPAIAITPTAVQGGHKFTGIATDGLHSCAVQRTGAVYCWGLHARMSAVSTHTPRHYGVYTSLPARVGPPGSPWVSGTGGPWTAIAVGYGQTCALSFGGGLDCWGQLLGDPLDGPPHNAEEPVRVGGNRDFVAFASGAGHDCAIDTEGNAWCWGANNRGQSGRISRLVW